MKIDRRSRIKSIKEDKSRRFYIILDSIGLFVSLAVSILSVITLGLQDAPRLFYRLIAGMMAMISFVNVLRFHIEKPKLSIICLLAAAVLAALCVII